VVKRGKRVDYDVAVWLAHKLTKIKGKLQKLYGDGKMLCVAGWIAFAKKNINSQNHLFIRNLRSERVCCRRHIATPFMSEGGH
jgi:hypothetical protein